MAYGRMNIFMIKKKRKKEKNEFKVGLVPILVACKKNITLNAKWEKYLCMKYVYMKIKYFYCFESW